MTFSQYMNYRFFESLIGWGLWAVVLGIIGIVKLVLFVREVRHSHREFERLSKKLMEDIDDV